MKSIEARQFQTVVERRFNFSLNLITKPANFIRQHETTYVIIRQDPKEAPERGKQINEAV